MEDINDNKQEVLNVERDLKYINSEVISKQIDGNYVKWSRILNAVSIIGLTEHQFIDYWSKRYKNSKDLPTIVECCKNKLQNGLMEPDKMINLIKHSKDFEKEKVKAIKLLGGDV